MSTLTVGTVQSNTTSPPIVHNSSGTEIGTFCRAWVNFNGTGTVAIRNDFNVSSITDNGVGNYTVNLTTAMPDQNYAVIISAQETTAGGRDGFLQIRGGGTYSTSAVQIFSGVLNAFNAIDNAIISVAVFR